MKCSFCGEEVGTAKTCPICGRTVTAKSSSASGAVESPLNSAAYAVPGGAKNSGNPFMNNPYLNNPYMPSAGAANQQAPAQSGNQGGNGILQQIADEKTRMVEECGKAVSIVYVAKSGNWRNKGTGWCGYGNYIITNAHVVEPMVTGEGKGITCEFSDKLNLKQKVIDVDLVHYNDVEDIAILLPKSGKIPAGVKVLKIDDTPTKQGELVFTVGNPEHYKFTYTEGSVANPDYTPRSSKAKYKILQTTLTLNHGNSGGPVMNANGDVVGMATFGEINTQTHQEILGYGFCVKSEAILAAIKEADKSIRR
ncbi:MAG: serine protease [Candidatus Coproplasma sp.]